MVSRGEVQARKEREARKQSALSRLRIAMRDALDAGVETEEVAMTVAEILRERGLLATADEVIAEGRKARRKK